MPLLSSRHRKERMDFAIAHKDWTVENWKMVVYSDETKINRLGPDGKKWVWKKKGEHRVGDRMMEGAMKFGGGSVMVWGCMMWEGVGYAFKIDGRMDKHLYTSMNFRPASSTMTRPLKTSYSNMMGTPNIRATRPNIGSRTWIQGPHMACSISRS